MAAPFAALAAFGGRLHAHNMALSDRAGECQLYVPFRDGEPQPGLASLTPPIERHVVATAPMRTLDSFDFPRVTVLKIDVEGHEASVLRGAENTIQRERPVLCVEIERRLLGDAGVESVRQLIREYG